MVDGEGASRHWQGKTGIDGDHVVPGARHDRHVLQPAGHETSGRDVDRVRIGAGPAEVYREVRNVLEGDLLERRAPRSYP